jgi:hypothetical protein
MSKKIATLQRKAAYKTQPNHNKKSQIDQEVTKRLKCVMPHLTKIRIRLVLHLFHKKPNTTGEICHTCKIGNLSDMVIKITPLLRKYGLVINNYPPASPLTNSFGEKTPVHYWELVVIDG